MSRYLDRLKALTSEAERCLGRLPTKPSKVAEEPPKAPFVSFGGCVGGHVSEAAALSEADEAEVEERKGMAMDTVPEPYLDAWARLQVQRPAAASDDEWLLAVTDAGVFLDRWGSLAVEFQWSPGDLFDVPRDGSPGGLVWSLNGEPVRALGPEHAVSESGRVFDRGTR